MATAYRSVSGSDLGVSSKRRANLQKLCERFLGQFPWPISITDPSGLVWKSVGHQEHWSGEPLLVRVRTERAVQRILSMDLFGVLDLFVAGEVDLEGNLYVLSDLKNSVGREVDGLRVIRLALAGLRSANGGRTEKDVRHHYDIPQRVLDLYLDRSYRSYSCGIFDDPSVRERKDLLAPGVGREDRYDSLEKAQWRKFHEAAAELDLGDGRTLLDIGTGYGGLLQVILEEFGADYLVGWTPSWNQVRGASQALDVFDSSKWEIRRGTFDSEERTFDRVSSIGMVSHVGPRGLRPYLKKVRTLLRRGGLYLHHDLMIERSWLPQSLQVGPSFNRKYVWPGFHWFTLDQHIRMLETTGFKVRAVRDLSDHYAKTTAAWYERMMDHADEVASLLGEARFRAWQVFLAGISGSLDNGGVRDHRILCEAI